MTAIINLKQYKTHEGIIKIKGEKQEENKTNTIQNHAPVTHFYLINETICKPTNYSTTVKLNRLRQN
jgi:hypothetical protein